MKKIFLILFIFVVHLSAFTQTLTLQDAINTALKKSLDIQVLRNNIEISQVNNNIGIAGGLPTVSLTGSDIESSTNVNQQLSSGSDIKRNGATGNNFSSGVGAGMLLYNGFRVYATKHRLEELELQSKEYLNSSIQNTIASVMVGYYDIVRQQAYVKTIDRSIDVATKQLNIVKVQQSVGFANNADLFQSQITLNNLLQQKQQQLLVIDQAKTALLLLMNSKPDSVIEVSDTIIVDKTIVLGDILNNITRNADVLAADYQIKINQLIVKESQALRYPSVEGSAGYNFNRNQAGAGNVLLNQSSGPYVGLTLGVPIFSGSVNRRKIKIAEINVHNANLQKDIVIRNYTAQAVQAYEAYTSSIMQLDSQVVNVDLAQKLIDLSLLRFQYHQATIIELTQAQQSFQQAAYTLTNLSYAAKSSEIELRRLTNQITF